MDRMYIKSFPRSKKGTGRREQVSSVRVPDSIKKELAIWKSAYEKKLSHKVSYEQMFRWWMDNIGYSDEKWDGDVREAVISETTKYVHIFKSKADLIRYLNMSGRFWEYCNQASGDISEDELIVKSLLYLELEDIPQLFAIFGFDRCKKLFESEIKSKDGYYSIISFLLESFYF